MQSQFQILYVDDHEGLRDSMGSLISSKNPQIEFFFAKDSKEALETLQKNPSINVAVIDINLGKENGLNLIDNLRNIVPDIKIVIYTMFTDLLHTEQALRKNINAFVTKDAPCEELEKALFSVKNGNLYYNNTARKIMNVILKQNDNKTQTFQSEEETIFSNYQSLTKGEKQIFELVANQKNTEEIANILGKAPKTVRNQISLIYQKMNLTGRTELVKAAKTLGVVL